ncbi:serine/threonine-protein kinase [Anaerolineales bacterium HSG6]|nr:serine/threonine-protein kinase [Anaerolineales bacterium HSG6]
MIEQVGRYELLQEIGQGGFAIVYKAKDTELGRMVALKELRPMLLQDDAWVRRFIREAKTVAQLDHPHVVTIYDVYRQQNRLFIVMHLIDGTSLDQYITRQIGLSWAETLDIFTKIAQGLDYAHEQGVLHRDLKPANILIDRHRGPMLTDFGLAKLTSQNSMSASVTGSVVGTPHYIAPEIWEGDKFTVQADIYAMGCILYEMLTGNRAFDGESPPSVMMAHFKSPSLPELWPSGIPNDLNQVLIKALANQPTDRFNSAMEMVEMLAHLHDKEAVSPSPVPESVSPNLPTSASTPSVTSSSASDEPGATVVLSTQSDLGSTTLPSPAVTPTSQSSDELAMSHQQLQERVIQLEETLKRETSKGMPTVSPTSPVPSTQEMPVVEKKRKWKGPGCVWISIITVLLLMVLLVFGVGSICNTAERIIGRALNIELSESNTQTFQAPLPPDFDAELDKMDVELNFGTGNLIIGPTEDTDFFLTGVAKYNVANLAPEMTLGDNNVRVSHVASLGLANYIGTGIDNEWQIELTDEPTSLEITTDHASAEIDLGGLSITDLEIEMGIGKLEVDFSEPNNVPMDDMVIEGGASDVKLYNLANSRVKDFSSGSAANDYMLDFSGELQNDMTVTIDGGLSRINIIVPEDIPTKVFITEDTVTVIKLGSWQEVKKDQEYSLSGEGYTITINIDTAAGNVQLRNPH